MALSLQTTRLVMRPTTSADAEAMAVMAGDFDVVRHTGSWPWPADPAVTAAKCQDGYDRTGGWLAAFDGQGDLVGSIGIHGDGEFGYMLARAHWGRGYATEMGRAVIDHSFGAGNWAQLRACVFDDNPASARVLEKLGFAEGPACRGHCVARGGDFPIRTFTLSRPQA